MCTVAEQEIEHLQIKSESLMLNKQRTLCRCESTVTILISIIRFDCGFFSVALNTGALTVSMNGGFVSAILFLIVWKASLDVTLIACNLTVIGAYRTFLFSTCGKHLCCGIRWLAGGMDWFYGSAQWLTGK